MRAVGAPTPDISELFANQNDIYKVVSALFFFLFQKMEKGEVTLNRSLPRLGSHPSAASVEASITPVLLNSGGSH